MMRRAQCRKVTKPRRPRQGYATGGQVQWPGMDRSADRARATKDAGFINYDNLSASQRERVESRMQPAQQPDAQQLLAMLGQSLSQGQPVQPPAGQATDWQPAGPSQGTDWQPGPSNVGVTPGIQSSQASAPVLPSSPSPIPSAGIDFGANPNWGTGASGIGGINLGSLGGGAGGGQMQQQEYATGGSVADYRPGGTVAGGPPGVDTVPANLNNGEYVLPAETSQAMGGKQALDQTVMSTTGVPPVGAGVEGLQAGAQPAPQQPTRFEALVQAMTGKPPAGPMPDPAAVQGYAQGGMLLPDEEETPSAARLHGLRLSGDQAQMLRAQERGMQGVEQLRPAGSVDGPFANYRARSDYNSGQRMRDTLGGTVPTTQPQGSPPATNLPSPKPPEKPPEKPGGKAPKPPEKKPKPPENNPEWNALAASVNANDTTPGLPNGYTRTRTPGREGAEYYGPEGSMVYEGRGDQPSPGNNRMPLPPGAQEVARGGTGRSSLFDRETMDAANANMRAGGGGGSFSAIGGAPHGVSDEDYAKMSPGEKSAAKVAAMEKATQSIRDLRNAKRFAEGSKPVGGWDAYNAEQGQRAAQAQAETAQAQARQAFNQDLFKEAYGGKVDAAKGIAIQDAKNKGEQVQNLNADIAQLIPAREGAQGKDASRQVFARNLIDEASRKFGVQARALVPMAAMATEGMLSHAEILELPAIAAIQDPANQLLAVEAKKRDQAALAMSALERLLAGGQVGGPPAPPAR